MSYKHFSIIDLADGIRAAVATPSGAAYSNAGLIDLGDTLLIFDTFETPLAAAELWQAAQEYAAGRRLFVINSHAHDDHWMGNQVFMPQAIILATAEARAAMEPTVQEMTELQADASDLIADLDEQRSRLAMAQDEDQRAMLAMNISRLEYSLDMLPGLRLCLPVQTFDRRLVFHGRVRLAELIAAGRAHSRGDCYLLLPETRIAFIGDLGFFECQPFMPYSRPEAWLQQLAHLIALDYETYVPGHGPVGTVADLIRLREYILLVIARVQSGIKSGKSAEETAAEELPEPYQSWTRRSTRLERNVAYLYEYFSLNKSQAATEPATG